MRANDNRCYQCSFNNNFKHATQAELERFGFICNRRSLAFAPVQSGDALFKQNKFSLKDHYEKNKDLSADGKISMGNDAGTPIEELSLAEKAIIGATITFFTLLALVILIIHCVLLKLKRRVWFLGY